MSDEVLAPILAVAILAALALWVPALHLCDGCWKRITKRADTATTPFEAEPELHADRVREVA